VTPTPPEAAAGSRSRRNRYLIGGGVGVLLIIIVVLAVLVFSGGGGGKPAGASVRTEPVSTAQSPFAPPQGTDTPPAQPVMPSPNTQAQGGTAGLYGGSLNQQVCDKNQMITYLQSNPDKGAAWASVLGVQPSQIPTYINSLTPVILRSDTLVTNHGFNNGKATAHVAVLQAGTAVLVDDKGEPVSKCYCGNPLTAPPTYSKPPTYSGPTWSYWHGGYNYTTVVKNVTVINIFVLVDVNTGATLYLPAGGTTPSTTNPNTPTTTPPPQTAPPATSPPQTRPPQTSTPTSPSTTTACDPNDVDGDLMAPEELAEDSAGCS
jgi:hypothetical protein